MATRGWRLLGLAFLGLYGFATLFPRGDTWGLHALGYLHPIARIAGLVFCMVLLWRPAQERALAVLRSVAQPILSESRSGWLVPGAVTCASFLVFYNFPIQTEVYGDTRTILHQWTGSFASSLFDIRLQKNDAALTHAVIRSMSQVLSVSVEQAFRILSALSGALSLGLWTQFVRTQFSTSRWGPLFVIAGCALGANQIFFGHVETYAFVHLIVLMFLLSGYLALERRISIWIVVLLFLLAYRAHAVAICLLPALVFLVASRLEGGSPAVRSMRTWPRLIPILVAPLAAGVGLYFFYFRAFSAPYLGSIGTPPPTFLPILPPPAARDYSLFSPAHLLDFGNVLLLVGTPVLVVLIGVLLLHRRAVDWKHPTVVYGALALLFPWLFFAAVNPLLSMPRDWDLHALLAAPLLVFLAAVLSHSDDRAVPVAPIYGTALAFCVFSLSFWSLNATPPRLSLRLEHVGEHVFRTYHANASYLIGSAQGMDPDTTRALARRRATIERLAPAIVREDSEYTHLLMMLASLYRERGDREHAVLLVERAAAIEPNDLDLALELADYFLWADETEQAERRIATILQKDAAHYDALVLASITAARKEDYATAVVYLERAAAAAPDDPDLAVWTANMKRKLAQSPTASVE